MLTGTNFGSSTTEEHNTTNNSVNNNSSKRCQFSVCLLLITDLFLCVESTIDNFSIRTFLFGYVAALLQSTSFVRYTYEFIFHSEYIYNGQFTSEVRLN